MPTVFTDDFDADLGWAATGDATYTIRAGQVSVTSQGGCIYRYVPRGAVAAGQKYTVTASSPTGQTGSYAVAVDAYGDTGAWLAGAAQPITPGAGSVSATLLVPAGTRDVAVAVWVDAGTAVVDRIDVAPAGWGTTPDAPSPTDPTAPTTPTVPTGPGGVTGDGTPITGTISSRYWPGATARYHVAMPAGAVRGTVVILHGRDDSMDDIVRDLGIDGYAEQYGLAIAAIDGGNNYWTDNGAGIDTGRMVRDELVPLLASKGLPTSKIGLTGYSMGGCGALLNAEALGPERCFAVAPMSAAVWEGGHPGIEGIAQDRVRADAWKLAGIPARIVCGTNDSLIDANRSMARLVPQAVTEWTPGGHDGGYWLPALGRQLAWMVQYAPQPSAGPAPADPTPTPTPVPDPTPTPTPTPTPVDPAPTTPPAEPRPAPAGLVRLRVLRRTRTGTTELQTRRRGTGTLTATDWYRSRIALTVLTGHGAPDPGLTQAYVDLDTYTLHLPPPPSAGITSGTGTPPPANTTAWVDLDTMQLYVPDEDSAARGSVRYAASTTPVPAPFVDTTTQDLYVQE